MTRSQRRLFLFLAISTLFLLAYVHEHILIYRVSYLIEAKEKQLSKLTDAYRFAKYEVARLHSPDYLTAKLSHSKLGLVTPREYQVIKVLKAPPLTDSFQAPNPLRIPFSVWNSFIKEAQAKTTK